MSGAADQLRTLQAFLHELPLFGDLTLSDVAQLCRVSGRISAPSGTLVLREGEPGDSLLIVLSGELEVSKRDGDQDILLAVRGPGEILGEMSLLEQAPRSASVHAVREAELIEIGPDAFRAMLERNPAVAASILRTIAGRLRSTEASLMQREKLASLGTLAAGLAHELNNPAAAIQRSNVVLREAFDTWRRRSIELQTLAMTDDDRARLEALEGQVLRCGAARVADLAVAREEDALATLLEGMGLERAWELAPPFAAYGWTEERLRALGGAFPSHLLRPLVEWLSTGLLVQQLIEEIQSSAAMISQIVRAVKSYAYLDQAPIQTVDLRTGIEDTLTMLRHKLKAGVIIVRDIEDNLPRIEAHAGELNQVWTNLIDNAVQAMDGKGRLEIRANRLGEKVEVVIVDDGPGIPPAILARIFDPFFTTKEQGVGTGLGLHIARNIVVHRHRGRIDVASRPGRTEFHVLLPTTLESRGPAWSDSSVVGQPG